MRGGHTSALESELLFVRLQAPLPRRLPTLRTRDINAPAAIYLRFASRTSSPVRLAVRAGRCQAHGGWRRELVGGCCARRSASGSRAWRRLSR